MSAVEFWFVHQVQAQPYLGASGRGDRWDTAEPVACWIEEGAHLVRDSNGNEVTSTTVVAADLADRANLAVNSKVTLPSGRTSRVLALDVADSGSLNLGLDHVEAHLE